MVKLYKYYSDNTQDTDVSARRKSLLRPRPESELISVGFPTNSDQAPPLPPPPLEGIREDSGRIESQQSNASLTKGNSMSAIHKPGGPIKKTRGSVANLLEDEEESKVGAAMSDITTKRVIVLVLVMLICIPLMTYSPTDISPSFGTSVFHDMVKASLVNPNSTYQVCAVSSSAMNFL